MEEVKQIEPKEPEPCIYSTMPMNIALMDKRYGRAGLNFGTLERMCVTYGIKYRKLENCVEYKAPKSRLQLLIEKLHFSRSPYSKRPL